MIEIRKANLKDIDTIIKIGTQTFIEAHSESANERELTSYLEQAYDKKKLTEELSDTKNKFHLIYYNNEIAGFSKICLNTDCDSSTKSKLTKLERLYIYKIFYDKKLGLELLNFNINLSKQNHQKGMWLNVWINNHRAINFYHKLGFENIGVYYFKLTETKANPNHQMLLLY